MYFFAFIIALVLTLCFTYLIRQLALHHQIIDRPFLSRKIHRKEIPLLGGVAIFLGLILTIGYFALFTDRLIESYILPKHIIGIILGGGILIFGGILDDKYNLKPWQQFIWPVLAVLVVVASGIGINYITNPLSEAFQLDQIKIKIFEINSTPYYFTLLADLFTLIWLLGMIYTTKFLDGLDGLVPGITVISSFIMFFLSINPEVKQFPTALIAIIVAGGAFGFLFWNFNPARIFLGEAGSTLCGFLLGILAIISGGKIATALLCMGIPILDAIWVILRRVFEKHSPFFGDKKHLHFRLLDIGFSHRQAVVFLWVLSASFGATALFFQGKQKIVSLLVLSVFMILLACTLIIIYRNKKRQT